ncbi:MAG TPA: fimbria/pilus periplasmic chaperone [Gallionella sp.]
MEYFKNLPLLLLVAAFASPVFAGNFSVNPVRIYMDPKDKAVAVTITNEGDEALVMQADLYTWKQKANGEDDLVLTEDLLLSPPIIKLAGRSRQVVRLARLSPIHPTEQMTYRMIVREIPEASPNKDSLQLRIALAFSLPIFITPQDAKYQLACSVQRTAADAVKASCTNSGTAYTQLIDLTLTGSKGEKLADQNKGGYILPAITRNFDIRSEGKKAIPDGQAKLIVKLDDGSKHTFDVVVSK